MREKKNVFESGHFKHEKLTNKTAEGGGFRTDFAVLRCPSLGQNVRKVQKVKDI